MFPADSFVPSGASPPTAGISTRSKTKPAELLTAASSRISYPLPRRVFDAESESDRASSTPSSDGAEGEGPQSPKLESGLAGRAAGLRVAGLRGRTLCAGVGKFRNRCLWWRADLPRFPPAGGRLVEGDTAAIRDDRVPESISCPARSVAEKPGPCRQARRPSHGRPEGKMSAPAHKKAKISSGGRLAATATTQARELFPMSAWQDYRGHDDTSDEETDDDEDSGDVVYEDEPEVFLLYGRGEVAEDIRSKVTRVHIDTQVKCIPNGAFRRCSELVVVQLNEGLLTIGEKAFQDCTALSSVNIPSTVTELGSSVFHGCRNLAAVHLNEGLLTIGEKAFGYCKSLRSVTLPSTITKFDSFVFENCINLTDVKLMNEGLGLQTVGENAFSYCKALRSIYLPSTVTELGSYTFCGCSNLTEVLSNEGLQRIGHYAFARCTSLRSATNPSTVTVLGIGTFSDCSSLVSVKLNDGLQTIGDWAFESCTELRSVTIPSSVIRLGYRAFTGCRNIAKALLNEGLQTIGSRAFQNCSAIRSVIMPSTVRTLECRAFFRCSNLTEVIFLGGKRLLEQEFFVRGIFSRERGLLNQEKVDEMLDEERNFAFCGCPLVTVKVSISWALSERMSRLPPECRVSVEERIHNLVRLEFVQDGNILACFPLVRREPDNEAEDDSDTEDGAIIKIQDTSLETARSVYQVLQLIAFHELKESSIVIELAMWKSRIDWDRTRVDCRVAIPGPAKSLIMEYCGFAGFLRPAIDGS
ncbi:hypothetical protein THAOC_12351 [Thalassiosira oceanica]|uniref:Uncharacterized protein n=1 Tax=Thalassiosira oceanica TaxID=159749 RepID=K0SKD6_THAOC|nr:hypothetical protein THAOC_12351 [Thalassiosira oceanica]|eukprot:EJK66703.1 hypothetical protein THAOC_12351 [Thalassiosira oceanica]